MLSLVFHQQPFRRQPTPLKLAVSRIDDSQPSPFRREADRRRRKLTRAGNRTQKETILRPVPAVDYSFTA